MKNILIALSLLTLLLFGCSSNHDSTESGRADHDSAVSEDFSIENDMAVEEGEIVEPGETAPDSEQLDEANRRIIYNAYLDLEVKQYLDVIQTIEETVSEMNGYIVSNRTSRYDEDLHHGTIELRIPQELLDTFFNYLANHAQISINQHDLVGEDVTDQYVDLETRLESREQLETRLLTFMEEAKTTEDLLNVSRDLANAQYEIERIKGQLNYIENRSDLATVELNVIERQTELAHEQHLDVWERITEQWLNSYNALLIGLTNLFVFIVGNLPVLALIFVIASFIYWRYRKHKTKQKTE